MYLNPRLLESVKEPSIVPDEGCDVACFEDLECTGLIPVVLSLQGTT